MDYILKNMHFIFTHFPIALLIFSFVFDLVGFVFKRPQWHFAGLLCLVIGTLGAIASVLTAPNMPNPQIATHAMFGRTTMYVSIALTLIRIVLLWRKKIDIGPKPVYLAGALIGVILVSYTGHLGGKAVHRPMNPGMMQGGPGQQGQPGQPGRQRPNGNQTPSSGQQNGGEAGAGAQTQTKTP